MQTITAHFKLVTPMFMGSANPKKAELRLSSINGVLRFWFRALAWDRLKGNMARIKQIESHVFGGIDSKDARKHSFLMRFCSRNFQINQQGSAISKIKEPVGLSYLGYGCVNFRHTTDRGSFTPDSSFAVKLHFRHSIDNNPISEKTEVKASDILLDAFKGISLLGGLGSRSRRGYGSVKLSALEHNDITVWSFPSSRESLDLEIKALLKSRNMKEKMPEYTAVSDKVQVLIPDNSFQSWDSAHNWIGQKMVKFRSYGRKTQKGYSLGGNLGKPEQRFKDDHDLIFNYLKNGNVSQAPRRCIFGLPHNYFFSSMRQNVDVSGSRDYLRRASPLFVRVYELAEQNYLTGLLVFPADFLPQSESIKINCRRQRPAYIDRAPDNWQTLNDFLDYCRK